MTKKSNKDVNDPCSCGSGKAYKDCCGQPARGGSGSGMWWIVLIVGAIGVGAVVAFSTMDDDVPSSTVESTSPAGAVEQSAPVSGTPSNYYYDRENNRHWDRAHNHWHDGPPPTSGSGAAGADTPPAWYYDETKNQHWDPTHNHWHEGPPPAREGN